MKGVTQTLRKRYTIIVDGVIQTRWLNQVELKRLIRTHKVTSIRKE